MTAAGQISTPDQYMDAPISRAADQMDHRFRAKRDHTQPIAGDLPANCRALQAEPRVLQPEPAVVQPKPTVVQPNCGALQAERRVMPPNCGALPPERRVR